MVITAHSYGVIFNMFVKRIVSAGWRYGLLSLLLMCPLGVNAQEVVVTATEMKDAAGFGGKKQCKVLFSVTNNAYGTIDLLTIQLTAYDDRGREVDELLAATAGNQSGSFGRKPVAVGSTVTGVGNATFKEECQYIAGIEIDKIRPHECGMRMLPENVECKSFTVLKSDIPSLKIRGQ